MIQCPQCQVNNADDAQFCSNCGTRFITQGKPDIKVSRITAKQFLIPFLGLCIVWVLISFGVKKDDKNTVQSNSAGTAATQTPYALAPTTTPFPPLTPPPPTITELRAKTNELLAFKRDEYSKNDLNQFDEVMTPLRAIPKESKDYKEAQALNKKLIDKSSRIAAELLVLGPKPESSEYDGRVDAVVNYLKANMNDYDNSEWLEWSPVAKIDLKGEPYWAVRLKLRGTNAFGGKILKNVVFFIRNNQVVSTTGL
jgi:hypothetical protein